MSKFIAVILLSIFLFSCATTDVSFNTNVEGAKIIVDGKVLGETPLKVEMKNNSGANYQVIVEKEGYQTFRGNLKKEDKMGAIAALYIGYSFIFLLLPALLIINAKYISGPVEEQYFYLEPETN